MFNSKASTPAPGKSRMWASVTAIRTRTMVVSVCALAATLWQGYAIQKHNRLMVQPILDTEINTEQNGNWIVLVQNNGLGPARVSHADIRVDGRPMATIDDAAKALGLRSACTGTGSLVHFYRVNQRQQVLSGHEACGMSAEALTTMLKRLSITLHYESLYGDKASLKVLSDDNN
ncbi:hypothetical protein WG899_13230 [Paucibacter sp. AS339]|uniref:hypothetical protein n=1 Tax=Paucibacter hankyongi TaxID=3133434 RepID=UPI00309FE47B